MLIARCVEIAVEKTKDTPPELPEEVKKWLQNN
jgi:hypothetical protein